MCTETRIPALQTQLSELNNRSRAYTAQLWQFPLAYLGLSGAVIGSFLNYGREHLPIILFTSSFMGGCVIWHMIGNLINSKRAVDEIRRTEWELCINRTAEHHPVLHILPLILPVLLATIFYLISGIMCLSKRGIQMDSCFEFSFLCGNILLGISSSIIASFIFLCFLNLNKKRSDKKRFSKAEGKYFGYSPSKENGRILENEPKSEAEVEYDSENRLLIRLTHDNGKRVWQGLITMENEHYGNLGFQYTMPVGEIEFGFKRCIVSNDARMFMLIGEAPPKKEGEVSYGREVFVRKNEWGKN